MNSCIFITGKNKKCFFLLFFIFLETKFREEMFSLSSNVPHFGVSSKGPRHCLWNEFETFEFVRSSSEIFRMNLVSLNELKSLRDTFELLKENSQTWLASSEESF